MGSFWLDRACHDINRAWILAFCLEFLAAGVVVWVGGDGWAVGGKWSGEDTADLGKREDGVEGHSPTLLRDIWTLAFKKGLQPKVPCAFLTPSLPESPSLSWHMESRSKGWGCEAQGLGPQPTVPHMKKCFLPMPPCPDLQGGQVARSGIHAWVGVAVISRQTLRLRVVTVPRSPALASRHI